jgi:hypothetical protein
MKRLPIYVPVGYFKKILVNKREYVEELKSRRRESFKKVIREVGGDRLRYRGNNKEKYGKTLFIFLIQRY